MDILKKVGFGVAIIGVLALVFTGGFIARGKLNPGCNDQDILIHEMQERIKRDSSLMQVLQKSSMECNKQAMGTIMQYERELQAKTRTIELLKKSNFALQDGLKELDSMYKKIDSTKFNKQQLQDFFNKY